ncbi:hypothetical protein SK128_001882, partial [Halocaridina rubra]
MVVGRKNDVLVSRNITETSSSPNNKKPEILDPYLDVIPKAILKNLEVAKRDSLSCESKDPDGKTSHESAPALIDSLTRHFSNDYSLYTMNFQSKTVEDACHKRLKKLVYSNLLYHRKEYYASSNNRTNEIEKLLWMTHVFFQQRRFDDANSLRRCVNILEDRGLLKSDSDVRNILRFLVALQGCGENKGTRFQFAKITPRITADLAGSTSRSIPLPVIPLHYGDTFEYAAEHRKHYMHFPSDICMVSSVAQRASREITPFSSPSHGLSGVPPGTGLNPLIFPKSNSKEFYGKAMGAMLQSRSGLMSPDTILNVPELPSNPREYCTYKRFEKTLSSTSSGA